MFLCTYIVHKASSCVSFCVIFTTRASIVCIDSGTHDTIHVSLALAIRFFDISINRYTPSQCLPFSIPAERIQRCIFGANLMILAQIHQKKLSHGQAEFPTSLSQNGQNDPEGQGQWPPFSIPAERIPWCMFGVNLVILAQIYDVLLRGQAKIPRILSQNGQNDFEGQGQWPLFSIPTKSVLWCMFSANLVIPAQICDELSRGQGKVYGQTDGRLYCTFDISIKWS